jgi:hypothetical protein
MNMKLIVIFSFISFSVFSMNNIVIKKNGNDSVSVLDFGAIGNGTVDDSDAFQKAIIYCIRTKQILYVPKTSKSYNLNKTIRVSLSRGEKIKIISNEAIITPKITDISTAFKLTSFKEHVFISIGREFSSINSIESSEENEGTEIDISGLVLDGLNQEITENVTSYNNDIYIGAQFVAEKVSIQNCVFKNIFGYGVRIHKVSDSKIKKCKFIDVGGRGLTPFANQSDLDAFGDAIFHAKVNANANIVIEDCGFYGKKNNNKRSRSALTFEFSLFPYKVNLKKLDIQGFAKCLHIEETAVTVFELENVKMRDFNFGIVNVLNDATEVYLNNCAVNVGLNDGNDSGDALAFLNYMSSAKIYVNNSLLDFNGKPGAYQSAVGLVKVENSTINGNNTNFFFADGSTVFRHCKFINFGGSGMSFFSNNPKNSYQIKDSTFKGNSISTIKASNVELLIKNN